MTAKEHKSWIIPAIIICFLGGAYFLGVVMIILVIAVDVREELQERKAWEWRENLRQTDPDLYKAITNRTPDKPEPKDW